MLQRRHIGGAPASRVMPCRAHSSRLPSTSNRRCSTTWPPIRRDASKITFRPKIWENGRAASATSSGPSPSTLFSHAAACAQARFPWLSIATFALPETPLVSIMIATSSPLRSTIAGLVAAVLETSRRSIIGASMRSVCSCIHDASSPTRMIVGRMEASLRSSSGSGFVDFIGITRAPTPKAPSVAATNAGSLPAGTATRSSGPTPCSVSSRRIADAQSRSSPYVRTSYSSMMAIRPASWASMIDAMFTCTPRR